MTVRAVIQARMDSSRLPGKSLRFVAGKTLLERVIQRAKAMKFVDQITIATTKKAIDNPIADYAKQSGVQCCRGSEEDVLQRFIDASEDMKDSDCVLRFTADNPLYDAEISEKVYKKHIDGNYDYTSIDGLSHIIPEFIKKSALVKVGKIATENFDREHVTPFFRKNPDKFKVQKLDSTFAGLKPDCDKFLTIDTEDQRKLIETMLMELEKKAQLITSQEFYPWLDRNQLGVKKSMVEGEQLQVNLAGHKIGDNRPCFIVAEIGQNHNGDMDIAKKLIDMAARCGANAVKFQKRDIKDEFTPEAYNAPYTGPNSFGKTYGEHREFLELNEEQHRELKVYTESKGLVYFCTPCDFSSLEIMERIGNPIYKIASRDLTNIPFLEAVAKTGKPVIMSTGMGGLQEIEEALEIFKGRSNVVLMHCVSQYPTEIDNVNLKAMQSIRQKTKLLTGLSDHNPGIIPGIAAAVLGAPIVEKHITISRAMKGTDQAGALEENGLKRLIDYIRLTERAMGNGIKEIHPSVKGSMNKLRRSLASKVQIPKGTKITEDMLTLKCPGTGMLWRDRHLLIGKKATRDISKDSTLNPEHVE